MRAFSDGRPRRSILAGFLALALFSSPAEALRMMLTVRSTPNAALRGPRVGARLKLQRKTPPQQVESTRPLGIRKLSTLRSAVAFDRGPRDSWGQAADPTGFLVLRIDRALRMPAYLRSFLPSSPQNPVFPPAEPVPLAS
jgi:hypothetical protein